jgi:hypothetical protein
MPILEAQFFIQLRISTAQNGLIKGIGTLEGDTSVIKRHHLRNDICYKAIEIKGRVKASEYPF